MESTRRETFQLMLAGCMAVLFFMRTPTSVTCATEPKQFRWEQCIEGRRDANLGTVCISTRS